MVILSDGMLDLVGYGNAGREIEQALYTLKKGSHLLKYGLKDESNLIWISSSGERLSELSCPFIMLKDATERFPPGVYGTESLKPAYISNGLVTNGVPRNDAYGERHSRSDSMISSYLNSPKAIESAVAQSPRDPLVDDETNLYQQKKGLLISNGSDEHPDIRLPIGNCGLEAVDGKLQDGNNGVKSKNFRLAADSNQVQAERIEQYEPCVYITLVALQDGTRDLRRVSFSRRRFGEHQAEAWWSENRERVHERHFLVNIPRDRREQCHHLHETKIRTYILH